MRKNSALVSYLFGAVVVFHSVAHFRLIRTKKQLISQAPETGHKGPHANHTQSTMDIYNRTHRSADAIAHGHSQTRRNRQG